MPKRPPIVEMEDISSVIQISPLDINWDKVQILTSCKRPMVCRHKPVPVYCCLWLESLLRWRLGRAGLCGLACSLASLRSWKGDGEIRWSDPLQFGWNKIELWHFTGSSTFAHSSAIPQGDELQVKQKYKHKASNRHMHILQIHHASSYFTTDNNCHKDCSNTLV